jgi:EPS-associated MarR family transcriptional regulator
VFGTEACGVLTRLSQFVLVIEKTKNVTPLESKPNNSVDQPIHFDMRSPVNAGYKRSDAHNEAGRLFEAQCGSRAASRSSKPSQDLRFRVLRLLEANPRLSHRDIADALGVSAGGVNYCVNALIEVGAIKVKNFRDSGNKLRYAYFLTPKGLAEKSALAGDFLARKLNEYRAIRAEIDDLMSEFGGDDRELSLEYKRTVK